MSKHSVDKTFSVEKHVDKYIVDKLSGHYSYNYGITHDDLNEGTIKVDPYFVAKMWQLGRKDDSGVLFHVLKTIARFGDKNSREREIRAMHASIKRLAEMEGVDLDG